MFLFLAFLSFPLAANLTPCEKVCPSKSGSLLPLQWVGGQSNCRVSFHWRIQTCISLTQVLFNLSDRRIPKNFYLFGWVLTSFLLYMQNMNAIQEHTLLILLWHHYNISKSWLYSVKLNPVIYANLLRCCNPKRQNATSLHTRWQESSLKGGKCINPKGFSQTVSPCYNFHLDCQRSSAVSMTYWMTRHLQLYEIPTVPSPAAHSKLLPGCP